jgi:OmpA-OmpF porin, OOP family
MHRTIFLLLVALGLLSAGPPVRAGSVGRKKPPPPLAKLGKKQIVLQKKIEFVSWSVRRTSYPLLRAVASVLRKYPKIRVRIEVHSDSMGSARYNLMQTHKRAQMIKELLVKLRIKAHRLQPLGRGEARPIASNRSAQGRAKNQRVEFHLIPRPKGVRLRP